MKAVVQSHVMHRWRKPSDPFMSQAFRRAVDDVVLQRLVQRNERRRKARHADAQALVLLRLRLRGDQFFARHMVQLDVQAALLEKRLDE